jgi:glycine/D-amino acid oxidase-like deaminating enzyme
MNTVKQVDYIIVGQGLAGSLLAFFLHQKNQQLLIVDPGHTGTASAVAAGIINPVTGRRYVKAWRIGDLLPFARQTYRQLETLLGADLYRDRHVLRTLFSVTEQNHWMSRLGDEGYEKYLLPEADPGSWTELIHSVFAFGEVSQGAQVNLPALLAGFRSWLQEHHEMVEDTFFYEELDRSSDRLRYRDWSAKAIVFCEGYQSKQNPFFNNLPYEGAKGEVLRIRIEGPQPEKLLRHHFFLVPLEDGTYWAGSNYIKSYGNGVPTPDGKTWLKGQLEKILKVPYEIVSHTAAVRPTVKDRRPLLGVNPDFPNVFIFNGLGTKGVSQGPFFAHHMASYLLDNTPLDPEVDIRRFHAKPR